MSTTEAIVLFVILFVVICGIVFYCYWDVIKSSYRARFPRKRDGS